MRRSSRESGAVLVYALIVLIVGAVILAGWVQVLATRTRFTENMATAVQRRITLENSRALASQYILQNVLPGSFSGTFTFSLGTMGGFSLSGTNVVPLTTQASSATVNVFSPGGDSAYTSDIYGTLSDGASSYSWAFEARSRSPIFGFDQFTTQLPNPAGGDINIGNKFSAYGNVVMWNPARPNTYLLTASTYQVPAQTTTTLLNNSNGQLLPSNFTFAPVTTGLGYTGSSSTVYSGATSGPLYTGSLLYKAGGPSTRDAPTSTDVPPDHVSVYTDDLDPSTLPNASVNLAKNPPAAAVNGVSSNGSGQVTIDLSNPLLSRVYIMGDTSKLILQGFVSSGTLNGDSMGAVLVVYVESGTSRLTTIELQNLNTRRLYLGVKKATNATVTVQSTSTTNPTTWRLAGTFENTPISFVFGTSGAVGMQMTGGLRTDQSITVTTGTLSIVRETNPVSLDSLADRNAWLETFRQ